jgi:hypothetical protein
MWPFSKTREEIPAAMPTPVDRLAEVEQELALVERELAAVNREELADRMRYKLRFDERMRIIGAEAPLAKMPEIGRRFRERQMRSRPLWLRFYKLQNERARLKVPKFRKVEEI